MRTLLLALSAVLLCASPFRTKGQYSQLDLPRESQAATVLQKIGTTDLTVSYSRPSVKGRVIWGDVVPYDQIWRAGANENTTFTCTSDITVEGKALPAGTYGLHMIPTKANWTVIFSKDHTAWGSFFYKKEMDALRIDVTPHAGPKTEQVTYDFADVTNNGATMTLRWAELEVPVKMGVDVRKEVLTYLDANLHGLKSFGWEVWYEAAHYFHDQKMEPEKAMKWVDVSIARKANFENQSLKATMLEEQGQAAEAQTMRTKLVDEATNAQLNTYAYTLMNQGKKAEAIKMFELNAKRHAEDPNVHDSLGEGYMMNGQNDLAIKAFKKSLSMNPPEGVKANSLKCLKKMGVDTSSWETAKS